MNRTPFSKLHRFGMVVLIVLMIGLSFGLLTPVNQIVNAADAEPEGPQDADEVEAFVDGMLAASMSENHVPGAVVVVVKDGELLLSKGYGYADVENKVPVDPAATLFRPGSISKLFTWTAVMQLVEAGELSLDEEIDTYLDFDFPRSFDEPITLRHVLSHTTGLEDRVQGLFALSPETMISLEDYVKTWAPEQVFEPGTVGAYSNYATAVAGYIVERVSGMPFEEYVNVNILEPLGMEQASFEQPLPGDLATQMANGYAYQNGSYIPGTFELVNGSPAGALSASGEDMAKFLIAHLQKGEYQGERILTEETAQLMHSQLYTADERTNGMAYGFFESSANGQEIFSHGGDLMLFHSEFFIFTEDNVGFFISTNGANGRTVADTFKLQFIDHYYPVEQPELTPAVDFSDRISDYVGNYTAARNNFSGLERMLALMAPTSVSLSADGQSLLFSYFGGTTTLVEVEPGLLVNPEHHEDRIAMKVVEGEVQLHPTIPFTYLKTPWYSQTALHGLIVVGGFVLFLILLIVWVVQFFKRRKTGESLDQFVRLSRWAAGGFGAVIITFLVGLLVVLGDLHPVFGVPYVLYGNPPVFSILMMVPVLALLLCVIVLVLAVLRWVKKAGTVTGRIFYSLLSLMAAAICWSFYYWNFLF